MENKKNSIIVVSGPTATGKTGFSIEIAQFFNAEIINFDSLVFYKELNIGTAKPTKDEMQNIPHHLVGTESIFSPINAADFTKKAIPIIKDCHNRGKIVVLVGGSGFYLQALLKGMYESTNTSLEILDRSEILYLKEGITPFLSVLKDNDPESFKLYHQNDHYRIRRAVEHFWQTGFKFSDARKEMDNTKKLSPEKLYNWTIFHAYLDIPKEQHFEIIQRRSQQMLRDGLIQEVEALLKDGADGSEKPLNSIGYKETISYLRGEFASEDEYLERLNINTRRLAKSQRTWFKKVEKNCYNSLIDRDKLFEDCKMFLSE